MESLILIISILNLVLIASIINNKSSTSNKIKSTTRRKIVLDTSAVIDGRILSLAEAGFLDRAELISTNIILDELQYLADEGDNLKRARARYGLEVLNKLSDLKSLSLITKNLEKSELEVDQQLLNLAKSLKAQLFTVDFNLAQRAKIEGVKILSPAELAEALKPQILPGEVFKLKLIQKGDSKNQAVGYLQDGTMVVAENCLAKLNETVELQASKIIQTDGGRIVFAKLNNGRDNGRSRGGSSSRSPSKKATPASPTPTKEASAKEVQKPVQKSAPPQKPTSTARQNQNYQRPKRVNNQEESLIAAINNSSK